MMLDITQIAFGRNEENETVPLFSAGNAAEVRRIRALLTNRIREAEKMGRMESEEIAITPAMAEHILQHHNRGNRSIRKARVQEFARTIRDGRWKTISQGISFARDGTLNNGQHRLLGIIAAGMPVIVYVTFGEHRDAFDVLDTGGVRGGADVLHIKGYKNTAILAGAARVLHNIAIGAAGGNEKLPTDGIAEFVASCSTPQSKLEDAATPGHTIGARFRVSPSACTVAVYLIRRDSRHAEMLDEFLARLADGARQMPRSPILTLRDLLQTKRIDAHVRGGHGKQAATAAGIIIAWNYWLARKRPQAGALKWTTDQDFPTAE
jgi:hypothetical protein